MFKKTKRNIFIVIAILVVAVGSLYLWHRDNQKSVAKTTSKQPSAQSNFTNGGTHASSPNTGVTQGGAKDNHGSGSTTPGTTGVSSASGVVAVDSPASGGTLASGDTITGTATGVNEVQYRVVDDNAGVVAQGSLNVINGTFSGTLNFKAYAKTGQLDVFTYNSQDQETNEVQLPVALDPNA